MTRRTAPGFTGPEDLYGDDGRRPLVSINFMTAHDGSTLNDLVSHNEKPNEANLEDSQAATIRPDPPAAGQVEQSHKVDRPGASATPPDPPSLQPTHPRGRQRWVPAPAERNGVSGTN